MKHKKKGQTKLIELVEVNMQHGTHMLTTEEEQHYDEDKVQILK